MGCGLQRSLSGPQFKRCITALACSRDLTFSALDGGDIVECARVHARGTYRGAHTRSVVSLAVLGDVLLSLGSDGVLAVWRVGVYDSPSSVVALPRGFTPSSMAHPDTYLNKVVVGSREGRLLLVNFATGSIVHEFTRRRAGITCIAPCPVLDVIGLGLEDG